jgi:ABC-type uncharacterized transport system substrate-binding protein
MAGRRSRRNGRFGGCCCRRWAIDARLADVAGFWTLDRTTITGRSAVAARYRLPAVYPFRFFAEVGGLLSYGVDRTDNFQRAATYVDRILKGDKPAELPVQAPTKFELVINLKTAKAIGLDVPLRLQQLADEVIE